MPITHPYRTPLNNSEEQQLWFTNRKDQKPFRLHGFDLMAILTLKWKPSSVIPPTIRIRNSLHPSNSSSLPRYVKMALNNHIDGSSSNSVRRSQRLPVLLFDVMDTIVRDPFYHDIPSFFGMSMKELLECKHPTAWLEFEKGLINEVELVKKFFKDGRPLDIEGLKTCMQRGYSYLEGVERLLHELKCKGYEMHAFTNYPIWYKMIEDKLKLSSYLSWTFCSCITGKRKPDHEFYLEAVKHLDIEPASCIFIDDRMRNVEAAKEVGIVGLQFQSAEILRRDLSLLGVDVSRHGHSDDVNEDLIENAKKQLS